MTSFEVATMDLGVLRARAKVDGNENLVKRIDKVRKQRRDKVAEDERMAMKLILESAALRAATDWGEDGPPPAVFELAYVSADEGADEATDKCEGDCDCECDKPPTTADAWS